MTARPGLTPLWVESGKLCPACSAPVLQDMVTVRGAGSALERVPGRQLRCPNGCRFGRTYQGELFSVPPTGSASLAGDWS
jgi:hypothetical protein